MGWLWRGVNKQKWGGERAPRAGRSADLGKNALGAVVVEARYRLHDLGGFTIGVEIGLHLLVDPHNRPTEGVDLLQMELEQEAVVSGLFAASARQSAIVDLRGSEYYGILY